MMKRTGCLLPLVGLAAGIVLFVFGHLVAGIAAVVGAVALSVPLWMRVNREEEAECRVLIKKADAARAELRREKSKILLKEATESGNLRMLLEACDAPEWEQALAVIARRHGLERIVEGIQDVKWFALRTLLFEVLQKLGDASVAPFLFDHIRNNSSLIDTVTMAARKALEAVSRRCAKDDPAVFEPFWKTIDDKNAPFDFRTQVVLIVLNTSLPELWERHRAAIERCLVEAYMCGHVNSVKAIAEAMGGTRDRAFISALLDALESVHRASGHYDYPSLTAIAEALADIGDRSALPRLEKVMSEIPSAHDLSRMRRHVNRLQKSP